jgi:ADP-heptose:LPS heptosyltransferase
MQVAAVGRTTPWERAKFAEVQRLMRHPVVSLHGETSIPQLFDVVQRAALVVASDSALTQIALAQRTPAVVMFGIEPKVRNGPLPEEEGTLMVSLQHWDEPSTAPPPNPHCRFGHSSCHTEHCRENSSLASITVDEAMHAVGCILSRPLCGPAGGSRR